MPEWMPLIGEVPLLVGVLMVSTGPWVAAVLAGKLETNGRTQRRLDEQSAAHAVILGELKAAHLREVQRITETVTYERDEKSEMGRALDIQRERADLLGQKLGDSALEFGRVTVHLLGSLPRVGDNGPDAIAAGGDR